jgi:hypothetical protein
MPYKVRLMSVYEILVFVALAGVGGYAYCLYRRDTRRSGDRPASDTPDKK